MYSIYYSIIHFVLFFWLNNSFHDRMRQKLQKGGTITILLLVSPMKILGWGRHRSIDVSSWLNKKGPLCDVMSKGLHGLD